MAVITDEIKAVLTATPLPYVATVAADGTPNLGPKASIAVVDEQTLAFSEGAKGTTLQNILSGSKVAVGASTMDPPAGYRFLGTAEVVSEGPAYETVVANYAKMGRPAPDTVVAIHVDEIFSLTPGPGVGKPVD